MERESDQSVLVEQLVELQMTLDDTITNLLTEELSVGSFSQPDPEAVDAFVDDVRAHPIPTDIEQLLEAYLELRDARPLFMWQWVHRLAPQNTLPCVAQEFTGVVPADKTITILFITMLDDLLEKRQDHATFSELAKIPCEHQTPETTRDEVDTEYVEVAQQVWETLLDRLQRGPNYEVYADLLRYDVKQAINAIEYSVLAIQRPDLVTMSDLERYESHNMVMFAYADIDLMHSSVEVRDALSTLREAIWTAQLMARIGNWVSTWERELREGDYSSGPVVYALDNGILSEAELDRLNEGAPGLEDELVERIKDHGVEKTLLARWQQYYRQLQWYNRELSRVDLEPFIGGTENVLQYHLASTGFK